MRPDDDQPITAPGKLCHHAATNLHSAKGRVCFQGGRYHSTCLVSEQQFLNICTADPKIQYLVTAQGQGLGDGWPRLPPRYVRQKFSLGRY